MIRFTWSGGTADRDIPAHGNAIAPTAIDLAGWPASATVYTRRTSATTWVIIGEAEVVTAEEIAE